MQLEGPVQLETTTKPNSQTIYFVELLSAKSEAAAGILRMVNRIEYRHKCKAVYRIHADRAPDLTGEWQKQLLYTKGILATSTAGYDKNSNGRAERAVQFFCTKARTMLSSNIRSEKFQKKLKLLCPFAVQHAGEVHLRDVFGGERCKYEFGQVVLAKVNNPETKFDPRLKKVLFLGFAPNVTNGYYVMNEQDKIELTSNITDNPNFDAREDLMELSPTGQPDPPQDPVYTESELRQLEAIMGPEGGGGWLYKDETAADEPDDPMQIVTAVHMAKVTDNLWKKRTSNRRRYLKV